MSGDTCPWCGANIVCGKDYSCGSDSYGAVPRQSDLCKYRCAERRLSQLDSELSLAAETIKRQAQRIAELEEFVRNSPCSCSGREPVEQYGGEDYWPIRTICRRCQLLERVAKAGGGK